MMTIAHFVRKLSPKKKFYDPSGDGMEKWIALNVVALKESIFESIREESIKCESTEERLGMMKAALFIHHNL